MKNISVLLIGLLFFSACSEEEKKQVVELVQNINIENNKKVNTVTELSDKIAESSGLAYIDGTLWTHNDSGDEAKLYAIDKTNGAILKTVTISNATNVDWEDLAASSTHLFIGDFGNNRGVRKNLKIYKIKRDDLKTKEVVKAEIIEFTYATQADFENSTKTNYDCEAFVAYEDKLYLFSKNHGDEKTNMYVLSMNAGQEVAEKLATFDSNALVTGASMDVENKVLVLVGYSSLGTPKTWIFTEFTDTDFFKGNQEKITWGTPTKAQIEGVTHMGKGKLYISSEKFDYSNAVTSFTLDQKLYHLDY